MTKFNPLAIAVLALLLSGCAGMNSEFEFDKPAKDSGIWMAEADDMSASASRNSPSAPSQGNSIRLDDYRLINTGNIQLEPQREPVVPDASISEVGIPLQLAAGDSRRPFSASARGTAGTLSRGIYCNAPNCFPEPHAAFRRPDGVARIWIAPYVSPDNSVHMGEVIYTVASPADWNGILM